MLVTRWNGRLVGVSVAAPLGTVTRTATPAADDAMSDGPVLISGALTNPRPCVRLLTKPSSVTPFDPMLELRRAIVTELAVLAFEAKRKH